jgi:hypothetical protein
MTAHDPTCLVGRRFVLAGVNPSDPKECSWCEQARIARDHERRSRAQEIVDSLRSRYRDARRQERSAEAWNIPYWQGLGDAFALAEDDVRRITGLQHES